MDTNTEKQGDLILLRGVPGSGKTTLANIILQQPNNNPQEIHTLLFVMFGCLAGIELPAIVLINEKYKPTQRLAVNGAFARISLSGNIVGLFISGAFIKKFGPDGLWLSVMFVLAFFLFFCYIFYTLWTL